MTDQASKRRNSAQLTPEDSPAAGLRILGIVRSLSDLRAPLRRQCAKNHQTRADLDAEAGLPDGYSAKLLAGMKGFGRKSLPAVLKATRTKLILVADDHIVAAIEHKLRANGTARC